MKEGRKEWRNEGGGDFSRWAWASQGRSGDSPGKHSERTLLEVPQVAVQ